MVWITSRLLICEVTYETNQYQEFTKYWIKVDEGIENALYVNNIIGTKSFYFV